MQTQYKRSRFFVDAKVQGALLLRTFAYWAMCLLILAIWLVGWRVLNQPADLFPAHLAAVWSQFGPAAIASMLLLPIVAVDIIRLSNRFAGPMFRMRRELHNLVQGEPVEEIRLRDHDFWHDFATDLSQVIVRYQELQALANAKAAVTGKATPDGKTPVKGKAAPSGDKAATPMPGAVGATAV